METTDIAARLCTACGMCCDGTLFQIVRMQPGDSPARLQACGLKLRRKNEAYFMEQPCSALQDRRCTVYADRPVRCRAFACQQLQRVEDGHLGEGAALALIHSTHSLVDHVRSLITACGQRDDGSALQEQYERVQAIRIDPNLDPEYAAARCALDEAMRELRRVLTQEFLPPQSAVISR